MTRTITLIIAAVALVFAGCQEGSGLEEAPADQGEEGADIEKASGLLSGALSSVADAPSKEQLESAQLAAKSAKCADLAEQLKALVEQVKNLRAQQANAAKLLAAHEASKPVQKDYRDDRDFQKVYDEYQVRSEALQFKVENLDKQLKALVGEEQSLRAQMVKAGCKDIPETPKPSLDATSVK